jgi:hypothetical protein
LKAAHLRQVRSACRLQNWSPRPAYCKRCTVCAH